MEELPSARPPPRVRAWRSVAQHLPTPGSRHLQGIDAVALRRVLPGVEHRRHKGLNNRAENSHRPVRKRERTLQRFKSPGHAQHFLEPFSAVCNHFRPRRHLLSADHYRQFRTERFAQWRDAARLSCAA